MQDLDRRGWIVALGLGLAACIPRTIVTQPALRVTVVDSAGAPVPGAEVVVHWWSAPYGRLEQSFPFVADAAGTVAAPKRTRRETVAPLCMHGVPAHHYRLCAGAAGSGFTETEIDPVSGGSLTITLPGGTYAGECRSWQRLLRAPATAATPVSPAAP